MIEQLRLELFEDIPAQAIAERAAVWCGDVLAWARQYTGPKFHALLCDPPYHLTSNTVAWNTMPENRGKPIITKKSVGFMGQKWDGGDIAYRPETWKALAEHLLPGAFGFAFASSRGWHRLACAIEDAGLMIHPSIFGWAFASGFPKSTRLPDERFNGHRYGLQALKPALEPIICFQKPYDGKPVQSITQHGAGSMWIDGGRIGTEYRLNGQKNTTAWHGNQWSAKPQQSNGDFTAVHGRWPANFCLQHHPDCERVGTRQVKGHAPESLPRKAGSELGQGSGWNAHQNVETATRPEYGDVSGHETVAAYECHPDCPVQALDAQAGELAPSTATKRQRLLPKFQGILNGGKAGVDANNKPSPDGYDDTGSASRFFHVADWSLEVAEQLAQANPVRYSAKASRSERDAGLNAMSYRQRDDVMSMNSHHHEGGIDGRDKPYKISLIRNLHPTVKPIALTRWLATLLLPPDAYAPRRLLVPFAGSGSELIGAMLSGWDDLLGIEAEAEYVALAQPRLAYWSQNIGTIHR
jgi:hypothetical protein